jgi:hypothetical protein
MVETVCLSMICVFPTYLPSFNCALCSDQSFRIASLIKYRQRTVPSVLFSNALRSQKTSNNILSTVQVAISLPIQPPSIESYPIGSIQVRSPCQDRPYGRTAWALFKRTWNASPQLVDELKFDNLQGATQRRLELTALGHRQDGS